MAEGIYPAPSYGSPSPDGGHYAYPRETGSSEPLVVDSGQDQITKLANQLNLKLDDATKDAILQYYMNERSADNAMSRSLYFNEEQYKTMVSGLRKAGLNPFLAISGLQGANQMSGQSVNSGYYTSKRNTNMQTSTSAGASIAGSLLTALVLIALKVLIP